MSFQQKTSLLLLPLEHLYVSLRDGHHLRQNFLNMQVLHLVPEDCRDAVVAVVMVVAAMCDHAGANAGEVRGNGGGRQEANAPLLICRVQKMNFVNTCSRKELTSSPRI